MCALAMANCQRLVVLLLGALSVGICRRRDVSHVSLSLGLGH